jgi:hypothetical protein
MQKIINKDKQIAIPLVTQGLYWYSCKEIMNCCLLNIRLCFSCMLAYPGNNSGPDTQGSGAYVFRPWSQEARPANDSRTM